MEVNLRQGYNSRMMLTGRSSYGRRDGRRDGSRDGTRDGRRDGRLNIIAALEH